MAVAMLTALPAFAGDKACCAKGTDGKVACANFASLKLTADQKTKLDASQADCMKAGCTKESQEKFMEQAKGILSAEQFATLKTECEKHSKKTEA